MALRADPPDFLDSSSWNVGDYKGTGSKMLSYAIGAFAVIVPILVALPYAGGAAEWFRTTFLGAQTEQNTGSSVLGRLD
jgi:hypothetical protein